MGTCTALAPALCCLVAGLLWTGTVLGSPDRGNYNWATLSSNTNVTAIKVNDKPYLRINNKQNNVANVNDRRTIMCKGENLRNDTRMEFYDPSGVKIQQTTYKDERVRVDLRAGRGQDPTYLVLLMDNMTVTDSGTYTCRAGELNDTITIIVNGTTVGAQPGVGGPGAWINGPLGAQPGVGGPGAWNDGPLGAQPGVGGPGAWNNGPLGAQPGVGGPGAWNDGPPGAQPDVGDPGAWNDGPPGAQPGVGGPGAWNNGPLGGLPGVGSPETWTNGPFGGQPGGVGSPTALNNGLVGGSSLYGQGPPGPPGGWNHGPIGGSGSFGPGGWYKGPIGGGGSLFGPGTSGRWHNEQTFNNQDSSKKADSDTLTVGTSGSSSPQEVHFALSLVPLLRAQPLAEKLQKEADILRTFNPNHVFLGFHQPIVYPGAYTPAQAY